MEQEVIKDSSQNFQARKPWIAGIMSALFPSLGQFYNGQIKKGAIIFLSLILIPYLFYLLKLKIHFWAYLALLIVLIALRIYAVIDSVLDANKQKKYLPKVYNRWYFYTGIIIVFFILSLNNFPSTFSLQTYRIPTFSSSPALIAGDMVVTDAYTTNSPDYGDLIVFNTNDGMTRTFRIIGLPKDTVDLNKNLVEINKHGIHARFLQKTTIGDYYVEEFQETLPNGKTYNFYRNEIPYDSTQTTIKNIIVPEDNYYVLGDNRDNAVDSRYIGFVHKDQIIGRVLYTAWSNDFKRIGLKFDQITKSDRVTVN